jgi:hypothetical protein
MDTKTHIIIGYDLFATAWYKHIIAMANRMSLAKERTFIFLLNRFMVSSHCIIVFLYISMTVMNYAAAASRKPLSNSFIA